MSSSTIEDTQFLEYQSPLASRYASKEMSHLFSLQYKHSTWRKLWVALAEAEQQLGLSISDDQINEMRRFIDTIDFEIADKYEKELQHDVMAHIHAYGDQCPLARPIIHFGATSCYVTDNTDLIQIKEGLALLREKLKKAIHSLSQFAKKNASLNTLSYTHFQSAQPTTVGKRACLWIQDLLLDLEELNHRLLGLRFLGVKGTTGTQASFLTLFAGDHEKVKALDELVAKRMGFESLFVISGQTYTRKQDVLVVNALAGIGISCHKLATDLRLLAHLKEVEEPVGKNQVGSSAMPYKRNPIYSERICSLARFVISLGENPAYTAATQWFERTLDDSANRRIVIAEAFLAVDSILNLLIRVADGLVVYPKSIQVHLEQELPFMMTETILMECVKRGGDRQLLHEKIRQHSNAAGKAVKEEGKNNDLLKRIADDPLFSIGFTEIQDLIRNTAVSGRAEQQVIEFLNDTVYPLLDQQGDFYDRNG